MKKIYLTGFDYIGNKDTSLSTENIIKTSQIHILSCEYINSQLAFLIYKYISCIVKITSRSSPFSTPIAINTLSFMLFRKSWK